MAKTRGRTTATDTRGDNALQWNNWHRKQSICLVGELTPQASALCRLVSFREWLEQGCRSAISGPLLFPGKQNPAEGGLWHFGGDLIWWSQIRDELPLERKWFDSTLVDPRSNLCYFNCGRSRQITTKGPLQWGFNGWTFYSFTQTMSSFFNLELPWQQYIISIYVQENMFKKVKTIISKYQRTCLEPVKIVMFSLFK
jgi:hypothetical protein